MPQLQWVFCPLFSRQLRSSGPTAEALALATGWKLNMTICLVINKSQPHAKCLDPKWKFSKRSIDSFLFSKCLDPSKKNGKRTAFPHTVWTPMKSLVGDSYNIINTSGLSIYIRTFNCYCSGIEHENDAENVLLQYCFDPSNYDVNVWGDYTYLV